MGKAKINNKSIGTWLEPYIGYEVDVVKTSKNLIYFKLDIGGETFVIEKYDKNCFDTTPTP